MLKSISLRLCTLIVLLFVGILSFAQQVQVKGTVVEKSSGESIIGASVMEVGSNSNGTITDIDGNFTLSVTSGATLSVSYIGYKSQEVKVGKQKVLDVILAEDVSSLDEVVVVAYGHQRKVSVVGAQSSMKIEDIKMPTANLSSAIAGRFAGCSSCATFRRTGA